MAAKEEIDVTPTPASTTPPSVHDGDTSRDTNSAFTLVKDEYRSEPSIEAQAQSEANTLDPSSNQFKRPMSNFRWFLVVLGLSLGAFLYGLDTTIAADIQGPILVSLGEIEKLPWVGIGFPMGSVSIILLVGCINGLFNIKYLIIGSITIFEIGSAICGAAPNMNAMICGRIIAGMGGSGMYIGALTYISIFTSHKERPIYNALLGLCWGTGCIVGPLIGGGFSSSSASWRWAFYINLPLAALFSPIYIFLFPNFNPKPEVPGWQKFQTIDWVGAALNAVVFTFFQVVLTLAGSTWKWNSPGPIVFWVFFGVLFVLYAVQQYYSLFTTPERRLFPVQFLKSRTLILLYVATSCLGTIVFVSIYYVPLFFQFTKGDSAIDAAVRLLPFIVIMVFFVMLSGGSLPALGIYMPYYLFSGSLAIIGTALMHTVDTGTPAGKIYGYEVLIAAGAGFGLQIAYTIIVVKVSPAEVPSAIGFINVAQIGSITIALSIAGNIFQNIGFRNLSRALAPFNFSESDIRDALGGATSTILANKSQVRDLALDAITKTISTIWAMGIAAGALCFVCACLMKREKLMLVNTASG